MAKAILQKKISQRIANGHPWIFSNEISKIDGEVKPGDIVEVVTFDNKFVGKGYVNPKSQITVRLLTRDRNETIDDKFIFNRIAGCLLGVPQKDWLYRKLQTHFWGGGLYAGPHHR